ncbi:MAG TPA: hypothetical protein VE135_12390 [Pyrinomonadaceae bacterium]|nr:hypothetical protein [Pyrinomonadaceae bacterium]
MLILRIVLGLLSVFISSSVIFSQTRSPHHEYLWIEAENMRGFATNSRGEPVSNPSWLDLPKARAPGWGMNGPGVSAEWSQGGESEWNSAAASADESQALLRQDLEVPRAGEYKLWVRYADWANRNEEFAVSITQNNREVFRHQFGGADIVDSHDEVSMYWGWAFTWDGAATKLEKGPAVLNLEIERPAAARRHVDCLLLTNDPAYIPKGREKPDFAAMRYLREWSTERKPLMPLVPDGGHFAIPEAWNRPKVGGSDFLMPWNIAKEFWSAYEKAPAERPLYPFNAEPIEEFINKYKGVHDVPLFASKLVVPVIYINDLPQYLKETSPFLSYLRKTKQPFAVLINYGAAQMSVDEGQAASKLLNGEVRDQFLGWISGESVGYVWSSAPTDLKISPLMDRTELLEAHRVFYTDAIAKKWSSLFHTATGPMWGKLIPAQSTSSTSFAHALASWGVRLLGMETAAVQPMTGMRIAFTRGAARQYGGAFLYYHAPNFGDTATTFTKTQNFAGPDNFFHSRYGPTMGPSLSWYRKSYYLYYMAGASAIYLEQGFDQFFKPGPGEHPFQLNPLGRITDEFMHFAETHPNRGTPYTPIAFLLDPAHGWDMTDYPHWPFEVSQINRSDRALRELFGTAYYPGPVVEGEPATGDRQAFVSGVFGDIFDVLVASDTKRDAVDNYRAVVVGGRLKWNTGWVKKLDDYVRKGGVVFLNSAQVDGLPAGFTGVKLLGTTVEADTASCLAPGEGQLDLSGQLFRYEKIELRGAKPLIQSPSGDSLVTINKVGKGSVVFCSLPDLLGEDERITPFAAHVLAHLFSSAAPVKVSGDVEFLLNRNENGWVVTLFNNNGVLKPQQGLAQVDRSARVTAKITLSGQPNVAATDWLSAKTLTVSKVDGRSEVSIEIPPGGLAIVQLK